MSGTHSATKRKPLDLLQRSSRYIPLLPFSGLPRMPASYPHSEIVAMFKGALFKSRLQRVLSVKISTLALYQSAFARGIP